MKVRYVAVGVCERCGKEFCRPSVCNVAVCTCESTIEVPLSPALILPSRLHKRFQKIADLAGIDVDVLVNKALELSLDKWLKERGLDVKALEE